VSTREGEGQGGGSHSTQPAITWRVTTSAKFVEVPHNPINIPLPLRWKLEDTHHYLEIPVAKLSFLV
jgi:hypothetical protein